MPTPSMTLSSTPAASTTEAPAAAQSTGIPTSGYEPKDIAYMKALRSRGWAPAISDADLDGAVTDAQGTCDELKSSESKSQKQLSVQGNAMLTVSTYGVDQATANKIMIFSAQTYCPEFEASVTSYLDPAIFKPTS